MNLLRDLLFSHVFCPFHELGVPKPIIAARQLAEINPFIQVEVVMKDGKCVGIDNENIGPFMMGLDLVVEVCTCCLRQCCTNSMADFRP